MPGFLFTALVVLLSGTMRTQAAELPLFDAHIHSSHDAWEVVSPNEAIALLRRAGVLRALVSRSSDDGTQKLEAPDLIVPELRPYQKTGETSHWLRDESLLGYLEERLTRYRYVAIGECHVSGADADLPVVRAVVRLARRLDAGMAGRAAVGDRRASHLQERRGRAHGRVLEATGLASVTESSAIPTD